METEAPAEIPMENQLATGTETTEWSPELHRLAEKAMVPAWQFGLFSVISFGIYQMVWMYRVWKFYKEEEQSEIWPIARTIFGGLFVLPLTQRVNASNGKIPSAVRHSPVLIFLACWFLNATYRLDGPAGLIGLLSFIPLVPLVRSFNLYAEGLTGQKPESTTRWWQKILILLGIVWVMAAIVGSFMPEEAEERDGSVPTYESGSTDGSGSVYYDEPIG